MMDLLGSYYLTGNETEQARNLFDDLQLSQDKSPSRNGFDHDTRLTAFDQEQRRNNELNPLPALARTSTRTTDTAKASSASKPTRATSTLFTRTAFLPKPAIPERLRTAVPAPSGNCFKCGKPGHFQDKCPLNATIKEMDRNDPEAEEQWEEAVELQSDASLEENDEA
ncbi:hypothetical protein VC83_04177 [Pseudogymnoascus destructans]|uniref:CCHC-type domain-containing protein n=1 Tax=Pseudogymnoascus destructans TaxID=655981 RepID=A0A177ACH8_9PEZI|nr:uncharacterized protein VC83_04177 [Pseudogymnoascus destructans]OAF59132.1 hypothetical protein VC83_04177 [Pseudogymnoascus destructans]